MRRRIAALYAVLLLANLGSWALLAHLARAIPLLLSQGALAYVLGLRHGFDADHIAAVDNTTRKLIGEGQRPLGVGLFFALGHSTIVTLLTLALVLGAPAVSRRMPALEHLGGLIGSFVSMAFLFFIAILNLLVLRDVHRMLRESRGSPGEGAGGLDAALARRGLMTRLLGRAFRAVSRSWHMYPVGLLFGLGFDTASEVALLGMATLAALHRMAPGVILVLPLLFAAGMTLVDTTDGVLMTAAYRWALASEERRIRYNYVITLLSVIMALLVGSIEGMQVLGRQLHASFGPWVALERLPFGTLGMILAVAMLAVWVGASLALRRRGAARPGGPIAPEETGLG